MKSLVQSIDELIKRRMRMITWKRWKRVNTRKSYWYIADSWILHTTLTGARFKKQGYISFFKYYLEIRV